MANRYRDNNYNSNEERADEEREELEQQYKEYNSAHNGGQQLYDAVQDAMYGRTAKVKTEALNKIKTLLASGADINTPNLFGGDTALRAAIEEGNKKIVELLLEAGARIDTDDITVAPKKIKHMLLLSRVISKKAKNQTIRSILENRAGIASEPGTGPANIIRAFAGVAAPRGAEGAFGNNSHWVAEVGPVPRGKSRKWSRASKGGKRTYRLKRRL